MIRRAQPEADPSPPPLAIASDYLGQVEAVTECPACGGESPVFLFCSHDWIHGLPGEFPLVRCRRCHCVYPNPRPDAESLSAYYPQENYYAYEPPTPYRLFARGGWPARLWYAAVRGLLRRRFGYRHLNGSDFLGEVLARAPLLRDHATFRLDILLHPWVADGSLLDVGCGSGRYLDLMRALGWDRTVGVDVSANGVKTARETLRLEAYEGDLKSVDLPADSFDAVTLSHTLEHVADPVGLLTEVKRVTKPGGRIAVMVPNVGSLLSRLLGPHWLGLETPRHLVNFSRLGLTTALTDAGLTIEALEASPRGSYGVALFSLSRRLGDAREIYTDSRHPFSWKRKWVAATASGVERALCAMGWPAGELLCAVARA